MVTHYLDDLLRSNNRVLLLQGPIGEFFYELGQWLNINQKEVYKINFNAGDEYFYPSFVPNTFTFKDHFAHLAAYIRQICQANGIDAMVCFGDNRHCHKIAKAVAKELNIDFWAFEEGYFRPHYVTFEKAGVNAYSPIPRQRAYFEQFADLPEPPQPQNLAKGFLPMAIRAARYYWEAHKAKEEYQDYIHHRILNCRHYITLWSKSFIKRAGYWLNERRFAQQVEQGKFGKFFIVPLQVHNDSQVSEHTDFTSVETFLRTVLESFATQAPKDLTLIVKHHPMDRGFIDYSVVIDEFERKYPNLKGRLFYIRDVPLPVFLRHGVGMVTLNSTSGLSGLLHNMPVKTLGRANYDFEGLTDQQPLADFWHNPQQPDEQLFTAYRRYHLHRTHINGSFYNKVIMPLDEWQQCKMAIVSK